MTIQSCVTFSGPRECERATGESGRAGGLSQDSTRRMATRRARVHTTFGERLSTESAIRTKTLNRAGLRP